MQAQERIETVALNPSARGAAADVLASAFAGDPLWTSLLPDPEERARAFPKLWSGVVSYCMGYGSVETTADLRGVACWSRPGKAHPTLWRMLRTGGGLMQSVMVLSPPSRKRFTESMGWLENQHRKAMAAPHWYLWALGVEPEFQAQGIGTALLQPVLRKADEDGVPCYLETQTERNVRFYRRQGFTVLLDVAVPGIDLRVWCMGRS